MNDELLNDTRVLDLLCRELDDDDRTALEAELRTNPADRSRVARLQQMVGALEAVTDDHGLLSETFDHRLGRRLDALDGIATSSTDSAPRPQRAVRWLSISAGVAAAVALLAIFVWPALDRGGSIVWADVRAAVGGLTHFHVVAFSDDPRAADTARRVVKIELFYRAPDQWRAQGLDHVKFVNGDDTKLFDAGKRRFVDAATSRVHLIPNTIINRLRADDLVTAVVASLFQGQSPAREPVRSDAVAAGDGLEVFDYAQDATQRWARIWVLKQSRLPLRMKVFNPRQNEFMLVTFDYSNPQPASYFDPNHFEKVVREKQLTRPHEILRAGAEPVAGKATNRGHVHEFQGAYKAPRFIRAEGNAAGAIMIEYAEPGNVAPDGAHIRDEDFLYPRDNWGNVYFGSGGFKPVNGNWRHFYIPVPHFKRGDGDRVVTLTYTIELGVPAAGKTYSHETDFRVLGVMEVPIGLDAIDDGSDRYRTEAWSAEAAAQARDRHLRATGSSLAQWRRLEQRLADDPHNAYLTQWAHALLTDHNRRDQARDLMEASILPAFLDDPLENRFSAHRVAVHLRQVFAAEGLSAVQPAIDRLRIARNAAAGLDDGDYHQRERKRRAARMFDEARGELAWLLQLPEALEAFDRSPKPGVVACVRDNAGHVAIQVRLPSDPLRTGDRNPYDRWRPDIPSGRYWITLAHHHDNEQQTVAWMLKPRDPGVNAFTLRFHFALLGRDRSGLEDVRQAWTLPVELPDTTVSTVDGWWSEKVDDDRLNQPHADGSFNDLNQRAHGALDAGDFAGAIQAFEALVALSKEQWPDFYHTQTNRRGNLTLYEQTVEHHRQSILKAKLRMGRFDEVTPALEAWEARLPRLDGASADYAAMQNAMQERADLRAVRLEGVKYLIGADRRKEASALLDEIGATRPDPLDFPRHLVMLSTPNSATTFVPRGQLQRSWRPFDTLMWDLADQRGQGRADPSAD